MITFTMTNPTLFPVLAVLCFRWLFNITNCVVFSGVHLILIGGVCQLIAGLLSFRKYDHLSGTAFIGYAALWGSYGATRIFLGASQPITTNLTLSHDLMSNMTPPTALTTNLSLSAELWNSTLQSGCLSCPSPSPPSREWSPTSFYPSYWPSALPR